jgi:hypothetical protein
LVIPVKVPATLATRRNVLSQSACKLRVSCLISRRYRIRKYDRTCFGSRYELDTDESDGFQIDSLFFMYGILVEQYLFSQLIVGELGRRQSWVVVRAGSSSELGRRQSWVVVRAGSSSELGRRQRY